MNWWRRLRGLPFVDLDSPEGTHRLCHSTLGPSELIIVLVIALLVLGPKRLPEVGRSIGNGMREFKDSLSGVSRDDDDEDEDDLALGDRAK